MRAAAVLLLAVAAIGASVWVALTREKSRPTVDHLAEGKAALGEYRLEDAEEEFRQQLAKYPTDGAAAEELRWILFNQFRTREVGEVLERRLQQLGNDLAPAIELLNSEFRPQVPREVRGYWQTVNNKRPGQAKVLAALGYCNWQTGDLQQAGQQLQEAVNLRPSDLRLRALAAEFALELGDLDAAQKLTDVVGPVGEQGQGHPYEDRCWWIRSQLHQRRQQWEDAITCSARAMELRPGELPYLQHHGSLLRQAGRAQQSERQLEEASRLEACLGELAEIVLAGIQVPPPAELCRRIAKLSETRGRTLQANVWRRAADALEPSAPGEGP